MESPSAVYVQPVFSARCPSMSDGLAKDNPETDISTIKAIQKLIKKRLSAVIQFPLPNQRNTACDLCKMLFNMFKY
jgi:hypothetical protein